jgi:uncharacterized membrane protein
MKRMLLLLLMGCGGVTTPVECADAGTRLTYANFGGAFLASYCVSCHGADHAEHGVNLSTEAGASAYAQAVVSVAGQGSSMPPGGSAVPSVAERAQLVDWLSCGTP